MLLARWLVFFEGGGGVSTYTGVLFATWLMTADLSLVLRLIWWRSILIAPGTNNGQAMKIDRNMTQPLSLDKGRLARM